MSIAITGWAELEHLKRICQILFEGPFLDMKERPKAGLIIYWLGRYAAQVLKLNRYWSEQPRWGHMKHYKNFIIPESNQTLGLISIWEILSKEYDPILWCAYMSQLRLALPECKYKHDYRWITERLVHIWSCHNQVRSKITLFGELSVNGQQCPQHLYEARKHWIRISPAYGKMLGIVTPNSVPVHAVKQKRKL